MADYCPKCGATLTGHYSVCVACGAAVGDPAAAPPIATWTPPPSLLPQRARARIFSIVFAVVVAMGIAYGIVRASTSRDVSATALAPVRHSKVRILATGLGVDIYPGARQLQHTVRTTPANSAVTATLITSGSFDDVTGFYESRLGSPVSSTGQSAVFAASSEDRKTTVMLTIGAEPGGQTKIGILRSTTR